MGESKAAPLGDMDSLLDVDLGGKDVNDGLHFLVLVLINA
jgi:hypothetical protein